MDARGSALHSAFVGAFRPYLKAILDDRGLPTLPEEVVVDAETWLAEALASLLELPYAAQRRSPLELVQEAMAGPTSALAAVGARVPLRDPITVAALPGDNFGIAPASSTALGEDAFEAHLAWGIEKARALAPLVSGQGRRVLVVSNDLMDRSRFEDAINAAGLQLELWGSPSEGPRVRPVVAFVDLGHGEADAAITSLVDEGVRVIAYGPHVDEDAMTRAGLLGAHSVLPRSRLFRSIAEHLPRIA